MRHGPLLALLVFTLFAGVRSAFAQMEAPPQLDVVVRLDSGDQIKRGDSYGVIFADVVHIPGAATIRLHFDTLILGDSPAGQQPALLRITSLRDGARQYLSAGAAAQWRNTSAFFNGDTLLLELFAGDRAAPSRVAVSMAVITLSDQFSPRTICGPTDDRLPSTDPRVGRVISNGCTAWLIQNAQNCILTAGHCANDPGFNVIEFNYPLSNVEGVWQHAHPDHQYIIDPASVQFQNNGIGDDWSYFGCFPNSNTGLTPFAAQGASFTLAPAPPPAMAQTLRVTGNGTTTPSVPLPYNRAQKTHTGTYTSHSSNALSYAVDTTGGNSGSPIIDEATGHAIGIHTHGGCTSGGGANAGTAINHPNLLNALANPLGVCATPAASLQITFPAGPPALLDPDGDQILVSIVGVFGGNLNAKSPALHLNAGSGFTTIAMQPAGGSLFVAETPAVACGANITYYISAQTSQGAAVSSPPAAPAVTHTAIAAEWLKTALADSGADDQDWTVENVMPFTGGAWERGIPAGGGDRGDPRVDFDGNYYCWLTDNRNGDSDVDGGPTRLISRTLDLTTFNDPRLTYARWFYSDTPGPLDFDRLEVHLSSNDGQSWALVESVTAVSQWTQRNLRVLDYVPLTSTVRLRFSAFDVPNNSVVEAAVDAVHIYDIECQEQGDLAAPFSVVDVFDLFVLLSNWGTAGPGADLAQSYNVVDVFDLFVLLANWTN